MKAALRAIVYPLLILASITIVGWEPDTSYLEPEMWRPSIGNSGIVSVSADTTYYEVLWRRHFGHETLASPRRPWRFFLLFATLAWLAFWLAYPVWRIGVENPNGFNRPEGP